MTTVRSNGDFRTSCDYIYHKFHETGSVEERIRFGGPSTITDDIINEVE